MGAIELLGAITSIGWHSEALEVRERGELIPEHTELV
jgi:hypothetical protein